MMAEYVCMHCDHVQEEHKFPGFFNPCEIEGCDCEDYEEENDL